MGLGLGQRDEAEAWPMQAKDEQQPQAQGALPAVPWGHLQMVLWLLLFQGPAPLVELRLISLVHDSSYSCHTACLSSALRFAGSFGPRCFWDWHRPGGLPL